MQAALEALVEPRRRDILQLVRTAELPAGQIAEHFKDVSRPAISQHLKVLREAGLVTERREGTSRLYRARPEGLAEVKAFMTDYWEIGLEALRLEAESEQRSINEHRNAD
jgi:DNA-binding transcriptional ArsR family regulator